MNFGGPPDSDTFEISLFGTGIGECLAVHIGRGNWFLVDSCRKNSGDLPAHLSYFQQIGVVPSEAVKHFIITHWHDDHIDGAFCVAQKCPQAKIAISSAFSCDEFLKILSIYTGRDYIVDHETSGVRELGKIQKEMMKRKKEGQDVSSFVWTQSGRLLFRTTDCDLFAISPSDTSIEIALKEFADIWKPISNGSQRLVLPRPKRNHNSIALWVSYKSQRILLGSDLEVTGDSNTGWAAVLTCSVFPEGKPDFKARMFKIPHHGSPNGNHEDVWDKLVSSKNPLLAVTSYSRGSTPRPSESDINRILARAPQLYCTTLPTKSLPKRIPAVERTLHEVTKRRFAIRKNLGHIRIRWKEKYPDEPLVELFGDARIIHSNSQ